METFKSENHEYVVFTGNKNVNDMKSVLQAIAESTIMLKLQNWLMMAILS